jgi:hypothetical protein
MANLEFVRDFTVPPKEIFVFFVPQRMPLWYGAEMKSCFEVQGGAPDFAVGQKVRITGRLAKREVRLTTVVTAYQWDRLFKTPMAYEESSVGSFSRLGAGRN